MMQVRTISFFFTHLLLYFLYIGFHEADLIAGAGGGAHVRGARDGRRRRLPRGQGHLGQVRRLVRLNERAARQPRHRLV